MSTKPESTSTYISERVICIQVGCWDLIQSGPLWRWWWRRWWCCVLWKIRVSAVFQIYVLIGLKHKSVDILLNISLILAENPTSWSPFSGLLTCSYTFPLLQLPAEITGTHLLRGILGRLPGDREIKLEEKNKCRHFAPHICPLSEEAEWRTVQKVSSWIKISAWFTSQRWSHQHTANRPKLSSIHDWPADLYLILVWPGRSRLEYCLDRALKSPSPFPLPPLAGSNVGLAAVVIFDGSVMANISGE